MTAEEKHICVKCGKEFVTQSDETDMTPQPHKFTLCPECYKALRETKKKWR